MQNDQITNAARDVLAERARQQSVEGWTPEHDDNHADGELARAAACYAISASISPPNDISAYLTEVISYTWPWFVNWWKPKSGREDLVRAGALIIAEIERLDRLEGGTDV